MPPFFVIAVVKYDKYADDESYVYHQLDDDDDGSHVHQLDGGVRGFQESYLTFDPHLGRSNYRLSEPTLSREITEIPAFEDEDLGFRIYDLGFRMKKMET